MRYKQIQFQYKLVSDFETTVYKGQTQTLVWSAASAFINDETEHIEIQGSIEEYFDFLDSFKGNKIVYFHNLKFDGSFILNYLLRNGFQNAHDALNRSWKLDTELNNCELKYVISALGQWYKILVRLASGNFIEFRDSLKLVPLSVADAGKAFSTKHRKLTMEYEGERYPDCPITDVERAYIANDVLVMKEVLEFVFAEGHTKLTIGSCCQSEFKKGFDLFTWKENFPDCYSINKLPFYVDESNVDEFCRKAYHGGWCYVKEDRQGKEIKGGTTCDVNSLYPSVMISESGNYYPVGTPQFYRTKKKKEDKAFLQKLNNKTEFLYIKFKCRFEIKEGFLPFVQIKGSPFYMGTEQLKSSDFVNLKTGARSRYRIDENGKAVDSVVTLVMTEVDYKRFKEFYNIYDFELLYYCSFRAEKGLFDNYLYKYKKIKETSTGGKRTIAKLYSNNLYGKQAASNESSYKVAYIENGILKFNTIEAHDKKSGYIPIGAAITSYAADFTIRAAQVNYSTFCYSDTDSIHCNCKPDEIVGCPEHKTAYLHWKYESQWDMAIFTRQKTYIEHITHENREKVTPYYDIKCAGMNRKCKELFRRSLQGIKPAKKEREYYTDEEIKFLRKKRSLDDFSIGLVVPGKLRPVQFDGGILLTETTFEMR